MRIFIFKEKSVYLHQKIRQGSLPDGKDMEVNKPYTLLSVSKPSR